MDNKIYLIFVLLLIPFVYSYEPDLSYIINRIPINIYTNVTSYNATYDSYVSSDTNASTGCSGTTTYLDGEGNCDNLDNVYIQLDNSTILSTYNTTYDTNVNTANTTEEMISAINITSYFQFQCLNASQVYNSSYESTYNATYESGSSYNSSYEYWDNATLTLTYNSTYDGYTTEFNTTDATIDTLYTDYINVNSNNITSLDCIIFDSGGQICSGS